MSKLIFVLLMISIFQSYSYSQPNHLPQNIYIYFFDPTVYETNEFYNYQKFNENFRKFLKQTPMDSKVFVWCVQDNLVNKEPIAVEVFKKILTSDRDAVHAMALDKFYKNLRKQLDLYWKEYHSQEKYKKRTSCLITAMYKSSKLISNNEYPMSSNIFLILASDMIEACNEIGSVNFENLEALNDVDTSFVESNVDLANIDRAIFIRYPSKYINTPQKNELVEKFWENILKLAQLDKDKIKYYDHFPSELHKIFQID